MGPTSQSIGLAVTVAILVSWNLLHQITNLKDIFVIVVCRLHFCTVEYFCNSCVLDVELWSSVSPSVSPCVSHVHPHVYVGG